MHCTDRACGRYQREQRSNWSSLAPLRVSLAGHDGYGLVVVRSTDPPAGRLYDDAMPSFEGLTIVGGQLIQFTGLRGETTYDIGGCHATVEKGAYVAPRLSFGNIAIGTLLLPGVGTIIGALARKNRTKVFLTITTDSEPILVEADSKLEGGARTFALAVNAAATRARASAAAEPAG
jgi:hypothetical protein